MQLRQQIQYAVVIAPLSGRHRRIPQFFDKFLRTCIRCREAGHGVHGNEPGGVGGAELISVYREPASWKCYRSSPWLPDWTGRTNFGSPSSPHTVETDFPSSSTLIFSPGLAQPPKRTALPRCNIMLSPKIGLTNGSGTLSAAKAGINTASNKAASSRKCGISIISLKKASPVCLGKTGDAVKSSDYITSVGEWRVEQAEERIGSQRPAHRSIGSW